METAFRSEELFTQEEFRHWIEGRLAGDVNRYELVNRRIVMSAPAKLCHGVVESNLHALITPHARVASRGITLGSSVGYDLATGDVLTPDFSFISRERWEAGPQPLPSDDGYTRIVPDLAVEIIAPPSERRDRIEKPVIYKRCGVREYWLVDFSRREVTLFTSAGDRFAEPQVLTSGEIPSRVLPELRARVEDVLAEPG